MANELYRTYEVLVEESVHPEHQKRAKDKTNKPSRFNEEIDGALRDTHMIFQDAVCYNTLLFAGLAGNTEPPDWEGKPQLLNPLWKHLTTPEEQGGIGEETEKVIRRLATHYKPLEGIKTAEEFLNHVYSEPLRIQNSMTDEQRAAVLEKRAACYEMVENAARNTKTGKLKCEGMAPIAKTWTGLLCVGKKASIPSELPYARFSAEVRGKIAEANSDDDLKRIFDTTIEAFRIAARAETERDLEVRYGLEVQKLRQNISKAETLPLEQKGREPKLNAARERLIDFEAKKQQWFKERWEEIRAKLPSDVKAAVSSRFSKATTASSLNLTEAEFDEAKSAAASVDPASKDFFRFREPPVGRKSNREAAFFRYWLLHDHPKQVVRKAAYGEYRRFIEKDSSIPSRGEGKKGAKKMPFWPGATYAFRFFGKQSLNLGGSSKAASSPSRELDVTAFQAAVEDVFKYKIRTEDRKARVGKLLKVLLAYENDGEEIPKENSPTGKPLNIRGMGGDPRWKCDEENKKGVVQALACMSKEKMIGNYGLREGTIGGWAEVRKAFLALHKRARAEKVEWVDESGLVSELVDAVDKEMESNRQGFGSPDFFHELCEPAHWHLWLEGTDYERHGVKDFIPHYASYCEWREELVGLLVKDDGSELEQEADLSAVEMDELAKRAIRYTWPGFLNRHKEPSYRYYDFAGELNTAFEFKNLFRRVRAKDANGKPTGPVERYEQVKGDAARATLAARRLKRDRIINKDTGNSVDALWCPPLILVGESNPTPTTHPRAGKYEDAKKKVWPKDQDAQVSFSLMATPLPGDPWMKFAGGSFVPSPEPDPVHLTVSFKIEANALATLQKEGVYFAGGSAKGVDEQDDKRKFLRWPVDIESDRQAAKEATEKANREATNDGKTEQEKPATKADVSPSKLWCAFDGGFLVKEGHYSKAQETMRVPEFDILSVDLGNRFAAAFTRFRIHADPGSQGREISYQHTPVIKAEQTRAGTLRLQGENAKVWDHVRNGDGTCKRDTKGNYEYVLEDETYGNSGRGRFPTDEEYNNLFMPLAESLVPASALKIAGKDQTYPELGDHIVFRLKRRIGRLRTLFNLLWRLCGKYERDNRTGKHAKPRTERDSLFHHRMVVETLVRSKFPSRPRQSGEQEEPADVSLRAALAAEPEWEKLKGLLETEKGTKEKRRRMDLERALKNSDVWNWDALSDAVRKQIEEYFEGSCDKSKGPLHKLLVNAIEFCLPLRGRYWRWKFVPNGERLTWGPDNEDPHRKPNVMGMRGLSMKRLEQILNLRQRCQSFAKLEDRYYGRYKAGDYDPPDSSRDELADSCPRLLQRSNRIRKQRVDQAAHLILAEALGMELKNPALVENKKERKAAVDLHGEYQRRKFKDKDGKEHNYPRCSVIVLENLQRYRTSQERTKSENSRLMKWAHRAIIEKLEDICRPFGITLMLADPAFSSHFDSRTGLPGVRVEEVSRDFEKTYPYNRWVEGKTKSGGETQLARDIKTVAKSFADYPEHKDTLVLAVEGGKLFCPVLPSPCLPTASQTEKEGIINADICAAGNIGLRGVADPQRWDIFPRLRTKQISETEVSITNWRGWFGKYPKDAEGRRMRARSSAATPTKLGAATEQKKRKKSENSADQSEVPETGDSQSGESSEYPPFFVAHPNRDWLPDGDWLKEKAFTFRQNGADVLAYPQGAYLKRVEQVCAKRIEAINNARIQKVKNM